MCEAGYLYLSSMSGAAADQTQEGVSRWSQAPDSANYARC